MSITDELREYADRLSDEAARKSEHGFSPVAMKLEGIADHIDAEHEKAEQDLIDANNRMEQLCECSIRLRVDAQMAYIEAKREVDRLQTENAKLREQMERLVTLLRVDWDIEASWDGLRRFWYVGLTDEGVRKRDEREATLGRGTMTADDVRDLIERHSDACGGNGRDFHNGAYVAIADELNATLGRGTCHPVTNDNLNESEGTGDAWANCSECGHLLCVLTDPRSQMPNYCPNCGRRIVEVD